MVDVKICGIKNQAEVAIINGYPVTYAGFIFAKSKRQVTVAQAKLLIQGLKPSIRPIGVFVDTDLTSMVATIKALNLYGVQLHGDFEPDLSLIQGLKASGVACKIFKTISIEAYTESADLEGLNDVDGIVFDTSHGGQSGGTGKTFDWSILKSIQRTCPWILAGGLSPENIIEAIHTVHPDVVDVNSALEVDGIKDAKRIALLFKTLAEV